MLFEEGEIGEASGAIGVDGARAGAALVRQMLEEGRQRLARGLGVLGGRVAAHASSQRSAVRSTTRAMKSISSWPMSAENASGLAAPNASTPVRTGSPIKSRTSATLPTLSAAGPKRPSAVGATARRAA